MQHHESDVDVRKKILKELKNTIREKETENKFLLDEIEELNVSVNERQHIHESGGEDSI